MNTPASQPAIFRAVIAGATSRIAIETARALMAMLKDKQLDFRLVGRDAARLDACAADLRLCGATATALTTDFLDPATGWDDLLRFPGGAPPDLCLMAAGEMPEQELMKRDAKALARMAGLNFSATASLCLAALRVMAPHGGTLAVIGSVAGDRGKASNYLYGATKRAIDTLMEGMEHELGPRAKLKLVLLKPGFVESPMTAGLPPSPLFTTAPAAGRLVAKAILKGKRVAYIPGWWRWIMLVIRCLPRPVFLRVKF